MTHDRSDTGHKTLEEVERYTRAAQRVGLADSAMALLPSRGKRNRLSRPNSPKPVRWDTNPK